MKRLLMIVLGLLVMSLAGLSVYVATTWNRVWEAPLPDLHATGDPATIERGRYLVFGPAHCVECHVPSMSEFEQFVANGREPALSGGMAFPAPPLGTIYSKNLTNDPVNGIGRYNDAQLARMLRYSVRPDGRASVRPLMPFDGMSDEDVIAVLSFLRAQSPVRHEIAPDEWTLIGKVVKSLSDTFKPRTDVHAPAVSPPAEPAPARGEYLARSVADCGGCHSPLNQLTFAPNGPEYSGGVAMEPRDVVGVDHAVWFVPPNLTPLAGSALMTFPDKATFVARFQKGRQHDGSPMPWESFARIDSNDLGALYEFLHALPAAGTASPQDPTVRQP